MDLNSFVNFCHLGLDGLEFKETQEFSTGTSEAASHWQPRIHPRWRQTKQPNVQHFSTGWASVVAVVAKLIIDTYERYLLLQAPQIKNARTKKMIGHKISEKLYFMS